MKTIYLDHNIAHHFVRGFRAGQGGRKPRLNDGMDQMHLIVLLAYCDAIVSDDGNVRETAQRVLKRDSALQRL